MLKKEIIELVHESERRLHKELLQWELIKEHEEAQGEWCKSSENLLRACSARWHIMYNLRKNIEEKKDLWGEEYKVEFSAKPDFIKLREAKKTSAEDYRWDLIEEIEKRLNK